jgi:hypothetical protein
MYTRRVNKTGRRDLLLKVKNVEDSWVYTDLIFMVIVFPRRQAVTLIHSKEN